MAASRQGRWLRVIAAATVPILIAVVAIPLAAGSSRARVAPGGTRPAGTGRAVAFAWLDPAPAPPGWLEATTATSRATLFYPRAWRPIPGDGGTVTVSLRDRNGLYAGYLNVTPREGAEQPHGWAVFRTNRNREEGDRRVTQVAAAEGLRFRYARDSCVIDDYLSKVGFHPYREIACIIRGRRHTNVFIGATLQRDWGTLHRTLERAASSLLER